MFKKILLIFYLSSLSITAQHTVTGKLTSETKTYEWIILYQLRGSGQQYMLNTHIDNGEFSFEMPSNASPGMYRITYTMENSGFVDFIYNKEDVVFSFDPKNPLSSAVFTQSDENILFRNYFDQMALLQGKLDSIQYSYFRSMASEEATKEAYHKQLTEYKAMQQSFEENSTNSLANHFIKAENKYYAPEIIKSPQEYLNVVKEHYFDYLDLTSEVLNNSSLISERIIDYIFYLNTSEDIEMQSKLYRASVNEVVARFEGYDQLKAMLVTTILQAFTQLENLSMVDYIIENHYKSLPDDLKDEEMLTDLNHRMRLAVGNVAPDFDFSIRGEPMALHSLKGAENYVIVFWSSTCDHCLEEMPKLHSFTRGKDQIEVIAIALESDTTTYKQYTDKLTGWIHVIGLGKWNNTIARLYEVNATPTYFVLNREKKIIAKPEFFQDVQWFFEH